MRLDYSIGNHPIISRVLSYGFELYAVGGFIRDIIHKGKVSDDIDFVLGKHHREIAKEIAYDFGATLVDLKKENTIRVVLRNGTSLDFSKLQGTIDEDLRTRDFTINAIAWSPEHGLIDPLGGIADIKKKTIRGILIDNFKNDTLRLLRTYRFSSELCFQIEPRTSKMVRELSHLIKTPAIERITLEFIKLLEGECHIKALKEAYKDGILSHIISLSDKDLEDNIKNVSRISENLKPISLKKIIKDLKKAEFPQAMTYEGILRLESVLHGSYSKTNLLTISTPLRKRIEIVNERLDDFRSLKGKPGYELLNVSKLALIDLLILSGKTEYIDSAVGFLNVLKKGLLTSEEIMLIKDIGEGTELGRIIEKLRRMQFEGKIKTKNEAKKFLSKTLH